MSPKLKPRFFVVSSTASLPLPTVIKIKSEDISRMTSKQIAAAFAAGAATGFAIGWAAHHWLSSKVLGTK